MSPCHASRTMSPLAERKRTSTEVSGMSLMIRQRYTSLTTFRLQCFFLPFSCVDRGLIASYFLTAIVRSRRGAFGPRRHAKLRDSSIFIFFSCSTTFSYLVIYGALGFMAVGASHGLFPILSARSRRAKVISRCMPGIINFNHYYFL